MSLSDGYGNVGGVLQPFQRSKILRCDGVLEESDVVGLECTCEDDSVLDLQLGRRGALDHDVHVVPDGFAHVVNGLEGLDALTGLDGRVAHVL